MSEMFNAIETSVVKMPDGLTKNEALVWDTLISGDEPLKAYEILDNLKEKGVRAPMTVYRALDGLEQKGHIHKLEGINSFVLCNHNGPHSIQAFLICDDCASAEEIEVETVESNLAPVFRRSGFKMATARLEVRGQCSNCIAKA